jgi:hypothetical protein
MYEFSGLEISKSAFCNNISCEKFPSPDHSKMSRLFTPLLILYEDHCCNISQRLNSVAEAWPIKLTSTDLTQKHALSLSPSLSLSLSHSFVCVPTRTCSFNCSPPRGLVHREQLDRCRHDYYGQPKQWKLS